MVIHIITGVLGTITKRLIKRLDDSEIRGRMETTQIYDRPEYLEESWKAEETYGHSNSSGKPLANAGEKNSQKSKIIIIDDGYSDPAIKLNSCGNMRVMVITILVGVLGTVPKGLEKRLGDLGIRRRSETIHAIALLRSARILRTVLET